MGQVSSAATLLIQALSVFSRGTNVGLLIGSLQALASPGRRHISSSVPPLTSLVSITFIFFFHLFPGSAFSLSSIPSSCSSLSPAEQSFSDMPVRCYSLFRVPMMRPPGNWSCSQDQHRGWGGWLGVCLCVFVCWPCRRQTEEGKERRDDKQHHKSAGGHLGCQKAKPQLPNSSVNKMGRVNRPF